MKLETASPIVALGEILWDLLPGGRRAGGAPFNFAFHCHQLGHPAVIVSRVGDDDLGRDLRAEVRRLGMSDEYIQTDREHPTGTVRVALDAAGQPTFTILEDVAWDFLEWEEQLADLAQGGGVLCFGTLAQRNPVARDMIREYLHRLRPWTRTVCDLNFRPPFVSKEVVLASIRRADWVKVNENEACEVLQLLGEQGDRWVRSDGTIDDASQLFALCLAVVFVTRGGNGCSIRASIDATVDIPGIAATVVDTVGAGDAFTAALVCRSIEGASLAESARFANAYAAVVASKPGGTPTVTRAEVERLL